MHLAVGAREPPVKARIDIASYIASFYNSKRCTRFRAIFPFGL